jgi:hypothetical protein
LVGMYQNQLSGMQIRTIDINNDCRRQKVNFIQGFPQLYTTSYLGLYKQDYNL